MNGGQGSRNADFGADLPRGYRVVEFAAPGAISRERSFVRPQSHHGFHHHQTRDNNKRRSLIINSNNRGKPTMEIYRPPGVRVDGVQQQQQNKLNVHAKEFTMSKANDLQTSRSHMSIAAMYGAASMGVLQHSKSSGSILHQAGGTPQPLLQAGPPQPSHHVPLFRPQSHNLGPILNSQSSGNILNHSPRVHFKLQPQQHIIGGTSSLMLDKKKPLPLLNGAPGVLKGPRPIQPAFALKRSKSLTSADALSSASAGMAALGLTVDSSDLGSFPQNVQENLDKALEDPRQLSGRLLMSLVGSIMCRAVEGSRFALPAARACLTIAARDPSSTFLDTLLNTCQQWYHEREKILGQVTGGGRPRLMAFLSFLLELYCQARRRTGNIGSLSTSSPTSGGGLSVSDLQSASKTLLTLICRCCEDCIRQPVPSPSDTENLFFILTYIGRDLESQLPAELENLLAAVRDAFLNTSAAPSIRKTLLQLIELHASRWQLPGCAVLYYYPSSKS